MHIYTSIHIQSSTVYTFAAGEQVELVEQTAALQTYVREGRPDLASLSGPGADSSEGRLQLPVVANTPQRWTGWAILTQIRMYVCMVVYAVFKSG